MNLHSYNKGEWSEVYVFFKVIADRKLYTADADFKRLKDIYLDVLAVFREEVKGEVYRYQTGERISIFLNGKLKATVSIDKFIKFKNLLWHLIEESTETTFSSKEIDKFLHSIFIDNPKSPGLNTGKFCGGTVDIMIETKDRSGVDRVLGFSIKSDLSASATLLNASGDNTNFIFEVTGPMTDAKMEHFNNLFKVTKRKGEICKDIATADRMHYLKEIHCDLSFIGTSKDTARANLIKCGGIEMPAIVGGMLKKFYYQNEGARTSMKDCAEYLAEKDVAQYQFDDLYSTYRGKISQLLITTFTGMKLGTPWNGRQEVNGGYIVVKNDGDVVAFHSTIADEFKDFLFNKMIMEGPSHSRHKDMVIFKENDKYYLKLGLQLRFQLSR